MHHHSGFSRLFTVLTSVLLTFILESYGQADIDTVSEEFGTGVNSKTKDCSNIETESGVFEKVSPSSKFLIFRGNPDGWTGDESRDICKMAENLEQAEITNTYDLQSLEPHITFYSVWLGLNQRKTPGMFTHSDGSRIKFQSFVGMEPNNLEMSESCVLLSPMDGGFLGMEDASCTSVKAEALCQFKKGSSCFLQSAEETASASPNETAEVVNLGVGSRFYISTVQKRWGSASETCMAHGLRLVTLDDDDVYKNLAVQVRTRLEEQNMPSATQFWTTGLVTPVSDSIVPQLSWVLGEETILPATELAPHQWAKATPDALEPMDQSGSGLEKCLDISFEDSEIIESTGSANPLWRASNCFLPKFFICERVPMGIPEEDIQNVIKEFEENVQEDDEVLLDGDIEIEVRSGMEEMNFCGDINATPIDYEVDITRPQTEEDIIKFLIFNVENDLKSGMASYEVKDEIKFKKTVIDLLIEIAKKAVDTIYVDHGLLNVVKIVILMYLNAIPVTANTTKNEEMWNTTYIPHLEDCLNATKKLAVTGNGFEIGYYEDDTGEIEDIEVPEEEADKIQSLDSAIDILWYIFSFTIGSCYNLPMHKSTFASDFHVIFVADFIHDLRQKWTINVEKADSEHSRGLDYSLALGDFDFMQSFRNLRYLVTAGYIKSGIQKLQLVRPLDMSTLDSELPMPDENAKTGNVLGMRR